MNPKEKSKVFLSDAIQLPAAIAPCIIKRASLVMASLIIVNQEDRDSISFSSDLSLALSLSAQRDNQRRR